MCNRGGAHGECTLRSEQSSSGALFRTPDRTQVAPGPGGNLIRGENNVGRNCRELTLRIDYKYVLHRDGCGMANITISIDDETLKKAKKIAIDHDTSFNGLVRRYVQQLVEHEENRRRLRIEALDQLFERADVEVGEINWSRAELHER